MLRLVILLLLFAAGNAGAAPQVVASIAPVHSIVAAVMEGVGSPELLIEPGRSPHGYTMRPSEARLLSEADMVVWVGPELETFLVRPLRSLAADARDLRLMEVPGMMLLPYRDGHGDEHGHQGLAGAYDPHIWLSLGNAARIAAAAAAELAALDPANAGRYQENAGRFGDQCRRLETELAEQLRPLAKVPYLVFHDAYRYFEHEFGLGSAGAITVRPELSPGVEHMTGIRRTVAEAGVRCIFSEPQFSERLVRAVAEGSGARIVELDPLGVEIAPGPGGYTALIRAFAGRMVRCLAGD